MLNIFHKSSRILFFFLSFCLSLVMTSQVMAAPQMDIVNFNSYIELENKDNILVTEEIHAYIPTSNTNQGMYRDIPINSRWRDKARQHVELKVRHISIDGKAQPIDDIQENYPFLRIFLRDRNAYLSAGMHRFVLQYSMTQQIGFFENNDELTWNVTGAGWASGIRNSFCMVIPPANAEFLDYRAWLGRYGSTDSPVNVHRQVISADMLKDMGINAPDSTGKREAQQYEALVFTAKRPIMPGEDFTVAVSLPKGIITAPESINPEDETWFTLSLIALLVFAIAWAWTVWNKYGKDPKPGPVIPLFYPPKVPARFHKYFGTNRKNRLADKLFKKGLHSERFSQDGTDAVNEAGLGRTPYLSAPAVNFIWNKSFTAKGLASLFISLAERGDCRLHGDEDEGFSIEITKNTSPHKEESEAVSSVPAQIYLNDKRDGQSVKALQSVWLKCGSLLRIAYGGEWKDNFFPMISCFIPSILGLFLLCWLNLGSLNAIPTDLEDTALGLIFVVGIFFALISVIRKMRGPLVLRIVFGTAFSGVVLTILGLALSALFEDINLTWLFSPLQWGLMALVLLAPLPFACFMDAPSVEIARLHREIEGLALYIGMAEKERFNFANPPDKPLELYHRLLPYAVALGLEEAWGARFADELARNQMQNEFRNRQIETSRILGSSSFMGALASSASHSVSAHQAESRASSMSRGSSFGGGGSGGGGAGSGGGGGGGGAC